MGWYWPVLRFWRFYPHQWVLAVIWNACEAMRVPVPFAHWVFGLIIGRRPH